MTLQEDSSYTLICVTRATRDFRVVVLRVVHLWDYPYEINGKMPNHGVGIRLNYA